MVVGLKDKQLQEEEEEVWLEGGGADCYKYGGGGGRGSIEGEIIRTCKFFKVRLIAHLRSD